MVPVPSLTWCQRNRRSVLDYPETPHRNDPDGIPNIPPPRYDPQYTSPDIALFNLYPAASNFLHELQVDIRVFAQIYQALNYVSSNWLDLFECAGLSTIHTQHLYDLIISLLPVEQASLLHISNGIEDLDINGDLTDNIS